MSDQDPNRPDRPTVPPQPHQLLDANYRHTPYFVSDAEAGRFRDHATPHLIVNLHHPPQNFPPETRNQFPGTDPIMDVREGGSSKPHELSYEQVAALKDVKDMTVDERKARDAKEFSASPPDILSKAQKERWLDLRMELLDTKEKTAEEKAADDREDPYKLRPRGELRKLKQLADLAEGKQG